MNFRTRSDPPVPDLSWSDDGWFTQFLPSTKAGEDAWRVMATHTDGTGKVFSVHAAEVERQDEHDAATIGVVLCGNEQRHVNEVLSKAVDWLENHQFEAHVADVETELIQV